MVKVFIKRSIAVSGFPSDMRSPSSEDKPPLAKRNVPMHGVSVGYLAYVAAKAARDAHASHIAEGTMAPSECLVTQESTR